jgi:hypothetical protein
MRGFQPLLHGRLLELMEASTQLVICSKSPCSIAISSWPYLQDAISSTPPLQLSRKVVRTRSEHSSQSAHTLHSVRTHPGTIAERNFISAKKKRKFFYFFIFFLRARSTTPLIFYGRFQALARSRPFPPSLDKNHNECWRSVILCNGQCPHLFRVYYFMALCAVTEGSSAKKPSFFQDACPDECSYWFLLCNLSSITLTCCSPVDQSQFPCCLKLNNADISV